MIRSDLTNRNGSKLVKANIEAIYPCNEMQQAFYLLNQQSANDPGVILAQADLKGELDRKIFSECWNHELARHEALRMSIRPKKDQTPMLLVWRELFQEIEYVEQREETVNEEFRAQLSTQIKLEVPPVSKVVVTSFDENHHRLFWAFHHLLLDGWSTSVVLRDVVARYCVRLNNNGDCELESKPSYSEYFRATENLDFWAAREYWGDELNGFKGSPLINTPETSVETSKVESWSCTIAERDSAALDRLVRAQGLTIGVVSTGAWSLVMHEFLDREDIAVGMTVAGRNLPLEGIQNFVGLLANVVPFRSRLQKASNLKSWLMTIKNSQFCSRKHEHLALSNFHELCDLETGNSLFDSLLVVENFVRPCERMENGLQLSQFESGATSSFPLTCYVVPGSTWQLRVDVSAAVADSEELAQQLVYCLQGALQRIAWSNHSATVGQLFDALCVSVTGSGDNQVSVEQSTNTRVEYSEIEIRLASIWERVLGIAQVLPNDNYFSVGGKSISAVRICTAIEVEFGVRLAPTMIVEYPTVKQLSKLFSEDVASACEIVRFNHVDTADVMVCVHAGDGYVSYFRHLARYFRNVRVIGVQSKGLNDGQPVDSFEELADFLVEKFESDVEHRRIHFVGYCMGAVFMFELSRCLQKRGLDPTNLFVIDAGPDWRFASNSWKENVVHCDSLWKGTARYFYRSARDATKYLREKYQFVRARSSNDKELLTAFRHQHVRRKTIDAYRNYEIKATEIPVSMIRSSAYAALPDKLHHERWRELCSQFKCCVVEGAHETLMLEPSVARVADAIQGVISDEHHSASSTIWRN